MKQNNADTTIYQARLNKIIFLWPTVMIIAAAILAVKFPEPIGFQKIPDPYLILIGVGVFWWLITWVNYHFSSLTIQPGQIIFRTGMLVRQTLDIPLSKVESIDIRQSIVGSVLGYGSLVVTGTGGTRYLISYINDPLTCRREVEKLTSINPRRN